MDKSSIAIGIFLLILFIGPILYMILNQSRANRKRLKNLETLSLQNQMKLDQTELTNSLLLGLDSTSRKLIIVEPQNIVQYDIIDLSNVNSSSIFTKTIPQTNGNKNNPAITSISVILSRKSPKERVTEIVFMMKMIIAITMLKRNLF